MTYYTTIQLSLVKFNPTKLVYNLNSLLACAYMKGIYRNETQLRILISNYNN